MAILVNPAGAVECIKVLSGHPLLVESAPPTVREWKFRPIGLRGKALAFCGFLEFHYATGNPIMYRIHACVHTGKALDGLKENA